ncbi:MAG TPA: lipid-A-disaccharide synthase [Rhodopirellula baltica]|uniref:lipid-A-disaccharide synthase n=1 Tax=Rhodopirellula baltica TaxID=265606 RepID=UPI0002EE8901|nr:lipid-A-disaccharide synthase [Rhodopirellula baltica]HBE64084.1 lipid-A-disaccharide synthase [Rhodopirellula baltica]
MTKTIFFSVGEPSGDQHAARLIRQLANPGGMAMRNDERIICRGFGGPSMLAAGCRVDLDLTRHAVVGIVEVLPKLREFFRFADQAEDIFRSGSVDSVVLVDFPGFNWHIAKRAKKYGIPVHYYCPPQLWAWGAWRVRKMKRSVDHVVAVLPVEQSFFNRHQIPVSLVGHPFFDAVAEQKLDTAVMRRFQSQQNSGDRVVAVLPGSRDHEVRANFPIQLETIRRLDRELSQSGENVRFAVAAYRDKQCLWCREQLSEEDKDLPIDFYVDCTSEIIEAAHCAMMVSGSVSLELLARETPAAVIYRVGRVLHAVGKRVLKIDSVTLPNLMAGRKLFPEFISVGDPAPAVDFLTETMRAMLQDSFYYAKIRRDLQKLRDEHARPGASQRAAELLRSKLFGDLETLPEKNSFGMQTQMRDAA